MNIKLDKIMALLMSFLLIAPFSGFASTFEFDNINTFENTIDSNDDSTQLEYEYTNMDREDPPPPLEPFNVVGDVLNVTLTSGPGEVEEYAEFLWTGDVSSNNNYTFEGEFRISSEPSDVDGQLGGDFYGFYDEVEENQWWFGTYLSFGDGSHILDLYYGDDGDNADPIASIDLDDPSLLIDVSDTFTISMNIVFDGYEYSLTSTISQDETTSSMSGTHSGYAPNPASMLEGALFGFGHGGTAERTGIYHADNIIFEASGENPGPLGGGGSVPEPSTVILILLGLFGLAWRRFKRREA